MWKSLQHPLHWTSRILLLGPSQQHFAHFRVINVCSVESSQKMKNGHFPTKEFEKVSLFSLQVFSLWSSFVDRGGHPYFKFECHWFSLLATFNLTVLTPPFYQRRPGMITRSHCTPECSCSVFDLWHYLLFCGDTHDVCWWVPNRVLWPFTLRSMWKMQCIIQKGLKKSKNWECCNCKILPPSFTSAATHLFGVSCYF